MNIEVANRLVQLRKKHGYSQEELAAKLGLSRQAVSKWERAEASPDTDNLILLSRVYGISLDDLLKTDDEIPEPREDAQQDESCADKTVRITMNGNTVTINEENIRAGVMEGVDNMREGIKTGVNKHIVIDDYNIDFNFDWDNDHDDDDDNHDKSETVYLNKDGTPRKKARGAWFVFFVIIAYVIIGLVTNIWHPTWLMVFLIPIFFPILHWYNRQRTARTFFRKFPYPVLVSGVFLLLGFQLGLWHPAWVLFLTIPLYYTVVR